MTVLVRTFLDADTEELAALWARVFPDDPPRNEPRAMLKRKVDRDPELIWVAVRDGAIVGAVMAGYDGVRGWLYHLAVDEAVRRQGIARALVEHAVERLAEMGCPKVNLNVRETNASVVGFYQAMGWTSEPVFTMGRPLNPPV